MARTLNTGISRKEDAPRLEPIIDSNATYIGFLNGPTGSVKVNHPKADMTRRSVVLKAPTVSVVSERLGGPTSLTLGVSVVLLR